VKVKGARGARLRARVSVSRGRMQISFPAPQTQVSLVIDSGAVVGSPSLSARVRRGRRVALTLTVTAVDGSGARSVLRVAVKSGR